MVNAIPLEYPHLRHRVANPPDLSSHPRLHSPPGSVTPHATFMHLTDAIRESSESTPTTGINHQSSSPQPQSIKPTDPSRLKGMKSYACARRSRYIKMMSPAASLSNHFRRPARNPITPRERSAAAELIGDLAAAMGGFMVEKEAISRDNKQVECMRERAPHNGPITRPMIICQPSDRRSSSRMRQDPGQSVHPRSGTLTET
ncbi:hypothetical protein GW17_00018495 [Ensete ventricosum]|nr:hypothetical protein GW17_00018495 [Ensete ventricosum]